MRVFFFFEDLLRVSDGCFYFLSFFFYMSICWKCLPEFVANIKNKRKGKKKRMQGPETWVYWVIGRIGIEVFFLFLFFITNPSEWPDSNQLKLVCRAEK